MSEREWRFDLDDMLRLAEKVFTQSAGIDRGIFEQDELEYDAILRILELIGEAGTYVPAEVREQHAGIPSRQVIVTRNRVTHGYLGIDNDTSWSIVSDDIDPWIMQLRAMSDL